MRSVKGGRRLRRILLPVALTALLCLGLLLSIGVGAVTLRPSQVWQALFHPEDPVARQIVWNLRLPRALMGLLVGSALAVSGALLQGVMRNPLAGPT